MAQARGLEQERSLHFAAGSSWFATGRSRRLSPLALPVGAYGSRQRALVAEPLTDAPASSERLAADLFASALADDELILSRLDALEELLELLIGDLA